MKLPKVIGKNSECDLIIRAKVTQELLAIIEKKQISNCEQKENEENKLVTAN